MAFLDELDVVNDQIATLGESPLNALDEDHPLVATGLRLLRTTSFREQAKGWWFNKELITLSPDADGNIFTPADAISVDAVDVRNNLVQRGRRLYDPSKTTYTFTTGVACKLLRNIPFTDLPPSAQAYIGSSAVLRFQIAYDADPVKTRSLKEDVGAALVTLNAEHTRNMDVNLLRRASTLGLANQLGFSPGLGGLNR